jgi:protein-tyrosine phosphatase
MSVVDFHNHLMPGVDDGAQTHVESAAGLAAMRAGGVSVVVCSPHVDASLIQRPERFRARMAELDAGWATLQALAADAGVTVLRGAELAMDAPEPDLSDERLRIAGTRFVLVEFAFMSVPPSSSSVLRRVRSGGWVPVLAHPERYHSPHRIMEVAAAWREAGAVLQVNGASLLGRYGPEVKRRAEQLLANGWVDYICSDYHCRAGPWVAEYRQWLQDHGGEDHCQLLTETNPARLLRGEMPLPVPPMIAQQPLWKRVRSIFR